MAENEEDDYMGDLSHFLPPGASSLPSKTASNKPEVPNKKRKVFNWHERKKLKREQKQIEEDQKTLVNLESAIPESNIGFKMLKQMGYTPGSALGKEGSGRSEPVGLEIRRGRAGIGKEDDKVEKMRKEMEKAKRDRRTEEELMETFGSHLKERWKDKRIVSNFHKADAVLAQLENREVVTEKKEEEDVGKDEEEEEEEPITEEITSQDKTTQTENENTIEEIIKAMNLLCAKVENMDKELQQIKSQQHDYKNAELSRSEDLKIPELQVDVGEDNVIPVVQLE